MPNANFPMPNANSKKKNNDLVNVIKNRLNDSKDGIGEMSENDIEIKNHMKQWILLKGFLILMGKIKKDED